MKGSEIYKDKNRQKIENILKENKDKPYLMGFYNFLGKLSPTSAYNYIRIVANFMIHNKKAPENLNLDDYTGFLMSFHKKTPSYQITVYSALKKFSKYLIASGRNMGDQMQFVDRPKFNEKIETKLKRQKSFLNQAEVSHYILSVQNGKGTKRAKSRQQKWASRDMAIVMLILNTGMRCAALYKLDLEDINLKKGVIYTSEKGGLSREHALSSGTIQIIKQWLEDRELFLNGREEHALFISNQRTRMSQSAIGEIVKKYGDFKDKTLSPHKLRATYGTQLYDATGDLYFVQQCMGHSNPQVTEIYIRGKANTAHQKASSIMENFLKG